MIPLASTLCLVAGLIAGQPGATDDRAALTALIASRWTDSGAVIAQFENTVDPSRTCEVSYHFPSGAWSVIRIDPVNASAGRDPGGEVFGGTLHPGGMRSVERNLGDMGFEIDHFFPLIGIRELLADGRDVSQVSRLPDGSWVVTFNLLRGQRGQRIEHLPEDFVRESGGPAALLQPVTFTLSETGDLLTITRPGRDPEPVHAANCEGTRFPVYTTCPWPSEMLRLVSCQYVPDMAADKFTRTAVEQRGIERRLAQPAKRVPVVRTPGEESRSVPIRNTASDSRRLALPITLAGVTLVVLGAFAWLRRRTS